VIAFIRYDRDRRPLLCVVNFAGRPHEGFRLGLPSAGRWIEVLNSDAAEFGGSGVGNLGGVEATDDPWSGRPASASFTLPPLAAVWFRLER
jgi:1,4-alpha-glucan branching enzyme